jgi:hypothetical protein
MTSGAEMTQAEYNERLTAILLNAFRNCDDDHWINPRGLLDYVYDMHVEYFGEEEGWDDARERIPEDATVGWLRAKARALFTDLAWDPR